ncbi:hypothetical protein [Rhizobium leguminosarum]|uniref:hypothetical protein n=1 Tax=Rhizobium leguminosarum TaxID=384 RepID=UPI001C91CE67|nr:hypothetical protein [Rhizobium leguminosarum]MBY3003888.1 hypothetical protein [Rhizobium leguminosarum]
MLVGFSGLGGATRNHMVARNLLRKHVKLFCHSCCQIPAANFPTSKHGTIGRSTLLVGGAISANLASKVYNLAVSRSDSSWVVDRKHPQPAFQRAVTRLPMGQKRTNVCGGYQPQGRIPRDNAMDSVVSATLNGPLQRLTMVLSPDFV